MSFEQDFKRAFADMRRQGAKARLNVNGCCRTCILAECERKLGVPEDEPVPYVWTFAGQGSRIVFDAEGLPVFADASFRQRVYSAPTKYAKIYLYHGDGGADIAAKALRTEGIEVEWNGSEGQAVLVYPYGKKAAA